MRHKIKIMGAWWTIKVFDDEKFCRLHPDNTDCGALTLPDDREIHFFVEEIALGVVRHEVRHAFLSELCLTDARGLSLEDFEEINCVLDQLRWDDMDQTSRKIFKLISK